jgi:signal transduction histidine kinase
MHLLANAAKYGPGKPIEIGLEGDAGTVRLTVRDRGIGIPADEQARIFERFERAVPLRHYGGLGLGLWMVRRMVEALDGRIRVESRPSDGATFTVELPTQGPTREALAAHPSEETRLEPRLAPGRPCDR